MKSQTNSRVELWKDYRAEIEENIVLQKSVRNSNQKLQILYDRLLKVFPSYENKYQTKAQTFKINLEKIEEPTSYFPTKINQLIDTINEFEFQYNKQIKFNDLEFSSKALDSIMTIINEGLNKQKLQEKNHKMLNDVIVKKSHRVKIKKPTLINFSVAIDGPSGVGKSTIARKLSEKWHLFYLNTGLVYRAIALKVLEATIDPNNEEAIKKILKPNMIRLHHDEVVELDNSDVTSKLRADQISQLASKVSTFEAVRLYALNIQKNYASNKGVIAEGRDTTFKLLPKAEIKIYLDTLPEVRAKRRVKQNAELGYNTNYDEILEEIIERDERDKNRKIDPLHQVDDAVYVDASYLSTKQVIEKINQVIVKKINLKIE